jgi:hypothetical protein
MRLKRVRSYLRYKTAVLAVDFLLFSPPDIITSLRLPSSVVEHPPCKRKVVSSILTGGSTYKTFFIAEYQQLFLLNCLFWLG